MRKCKNCECRHDGEIPGFELGECYCHRIGGPWIYPTEHPYEPEDEDPTS
jgi:hypothetical protein